MAESNGRVLCIPSLDLTPQEIVAQLETGDVNMEEFVLWQQAREKRAVESNGASKYKLYVKVSAKGAASVYGLQRMPVTLYVEQWDRLIAFTPELATWLNEHRDVLGTKENPKSYPELAKAKPAEKAESEPAAAAA